MLDDILKRAAYLKSQYDQQKPGWNKDIVYSRFKKEIAAINLTSTEYESAIRKLCDAIGY